MQVILCAPLQRISGEIVISAMPKAPRGFFYEYRGLGWQYGEEFAVYELRVANEPCTELAHLLKGADGHDGRPLECRDFDPDATVAAR